MKPAGTVSSDASRVAGLQSFMQTPIYGSETKRSMNAAWPAAKEPTQ